MANRALCTEFMVELCALVRNAFELRQKIIDQLKEILLAKPSKDFKQHIKNVLLVFNSKLKIPGEYLIKQFGPKPELLEKLEAYLTNCEIAVDDFKTILDQIDTLHTLFIRTLHERPSKH